MARCAERAPLPPVEKITINFDEEDVLEYIPEEEPGSVGQYVNGEKLGVATKLVWKPKNGKLKDQDGNGGVVPEEPRLLEKIEVFCETHKVPLEVKGDDLTLKFRTPSGDAVSYTVGFGCLKVAVNGDSKGCAYRVTHDSKSRTIDAGGVLAQLPEGPEKEGCEVLYLIANICRVCHVPHDIDFGDE